MHFRIKDEIGHMLKAKNKSKKKKFKSIARMTMTDRLMLFFSGVWTSSIAMSVVNEKISMSIIFASILILSMSFISLKHIFRGSPQFDGTCNFYDKDVSRLYSDDETLCVLCKFFGMFLGVYTDSFSGMKSKRLALFWPNGDLCMKKSEILNCNGDEVSIMDPISTPFTSFDFSEINSERALRLIKTIVSSTTIGGSKILNYDGTMEADIPEFKTANELKMKLDINGAKTYVRDLHQKQKNRK